MGYVIPYHTKKLWEDFNIEFGIISMQGKESKHSALKQELNGNTNQSNEQKSRGKWFQISHQIPLPCVTLSLPLLISQGN